MNDYGENSYIPTMAEAEKDEHDHSDCRFGNECAACRSWRNRPPAGVHG
jgi:hypothetical protein